MASERNISKLVFNVIVTVITFLSLECCTNNNTPNGNNTPKGNNTSELNSFAFMGEAIDHPANFDKDTIVTPENIEYLYRLFRLDTLFNGDYYLVRSKESNTSSRYLSRLIRMKNGKQAAAQTFYDSEIEPDNILRLGKSLVVGLNSLRVNNYDSTFHHTSHKCRIIVLSESLTPITGRRYYCNEEHTYIESLLQNSDTTFYCSIASGNGKNEPLFHYQFCSNKKFIIKNDTAFARYENAYQIESENVNLSELDWGNDLSDDEIEVAKAHEAAKNEELRDLQNENAGNSTQNNPGNQMPDSIEEHAYVDLGLSVLWASCNIGANLPEEFGDYYAWGEISTKEKYTEENYKWFDTTKKTKWGNCLLIKYNSDGNDGYVDNKSKLDAADDVATVKWGKGWRIPTYKEWNELRNKCSWRWIVLGDIYGYQVTSSVNNNSIFLPAAGEGGYQDQKGHYWASTINYSYNAQSVDFDKIGKKLSYYPGYRVNGYSVRPVKELESIDENAMKTHKVR